VRELLDGLFRGSKSGGDVDFKVVHKAH
jgi:hypothetical protein